jgi:small-conductance mechanosensitive channel
MNLAMKRVDLIRRITSYAVLFISVLVCGNVGSHGQDTNKSNPPQAPQQPASQPSISPLPVQLDGNAVLHHLNQVISWYRHMTTSVRDVGLPSDAIYQDNAKALGAKAVQLAFQSAKSQSALIAGQQGEAPNQGAGNTQQQRIEQLRAKITAQVDQLQKQIDELSTRIPKTAASRRTGLMSQRDVLKAQLDLQKSRLDVMQKMSSFIESSGETARGLEGDINRLAQSVPEVLGPNSGKGETQDKIAAAKSPSKPGLANSGGLIGDAMTLYDYTTVLRQISSVIKETNYTHDVTEEVRKPLRDALRAALQQSQQSDTQSAASDPQQLQEQRQQLQEINERFKQLSNALLPLSQELIVLNNARTNLDQWRDSIVRESTYVLRSVLLRVLMILIALAAVLVFSEVWRRVTFRYVTDARRRRQFLVLRRVVIGFLVVVVLTFGFVSQFSSLATFAGFITAGIAVGLQAVLLSIAAYFFIIGRYGIRVGDRISVAGITGDVVDIGLVRMYVLELAGTGLDFYPTGRIVAFSNSVLFQTGTPLFRQIPGTEYTWHEVVVRLVPDANHKAAEEKLMAVVEDVYSKYRGEIERQHAAIERRVDIQVDMPRPEARLQFADTGLELLVRYPVEIRQAPNTDEEMTRRVLELIAKDDAVKATVSGTPKIRSAIKG